MTAHGKAHSIGSEIPWVKMAANVAGVGNGAHGIAHIQASLSYFQNVSPLNHVSNKISSSPLTLGFSLSLLVVELFHF